jgi:hypothetical protein
MILFAATELDQCAVLHSLFLKHITHPRIFSILVFTLVLKNCSAINTAKSKFWPVIPKWDAPVSFANFASIRGHSSMPYEPKREFAVRKTVQELGQWFRVLSHWQILQNPSQHCESEANHVMKKAINILPQTFLT